MYGVEVVNMKKYINGKEVNYKTKSCGLNGTAGVELTDYYINMYVVLTRNCNVSCKFCTFCKNGVGFDILKFEEIIKEVTKEFKLGKVSFTGGEPTLNIEDLKSALQILKRYAPYVFTSVNTNGTNLRELEDILDLDNIALSRHSSLEEENRYLMGVSTKNILSDENILNFKEKEKLHLSCNLVKNYVDNSSKIIEYLEFAASMGIDDVGFVSLMPVNDFSKEHFVDFKSIDFSMYPKVINNKSYSKLESGLEVCRCNNYLYTSKLGGVVAFYSRYVVERDSPSDYLVYEDNKLKQGFNGTQII